MYKIIEVANAHGGNAKYLWDLILAVESINYDTGIKFQPFKFNRISTPDYPWYSVYRDLFFSPEQWNGFIGEASKSKDVWIDVFDTYSVEILNQNISLVKGIKLQTSVLFNVEVFDALRALNLSSKVIILNIAGRSLEEIDSVMLKYQSELHPCDIWLEVGFQGYPTALEDSGISKIKTLSRRYNKKIVFADHVAAESELAHWLPIVALAAGAHAIEKHVMLSDRETKFDYHSSMTPDQYLRLSAELSRFNILIDGEFVNYRETAYLRETEMKPILIKSVKKQSILNLSSDFIFRRSSQSGLTASEILEKQHNYNMLCVNKHEGQTLFDQDFKRAKIGAVVACRLKSSRLKKKALLKVGSLSSVEFCIRNVLRLSDVDEVVLASSSLPQDALLADYCYSDKVLFFQGSANDVLDRYFEIAMSRDLDVIVRITADMPFVDNDIFSILLESHFNTAADYTTAAHAAPGTNIEIINTSALATVKEYFPIAQHSEYMTWYFQNNPDYFILNFVDLPEELVRNYRLTLDYSEDLELLNRIAGYFESCNISEYSLRDVFCFLDQNPEVSSLNSHLTLRYVSDHELIAMLDRETKINMT